MLYGDFNPSGRLPYTIAKSVSDCSAQPVTGRGPDDIVIIPYPDGLAIDYRHFDASGIEPRFEFGFGLSYTTFSYSDLFITPVTAGEDSDSQAEAGWANGLPTPTGVGSSTALWLHRPAYEVSFTVTNTGEVPGTEVRVMGRILSSATNR